MDAEAKLRVAEHYGTIGDVQTVPEHFVKTFDEADRAWRVLATHHLGRKDWPMIAFFADKIHQLEVRLAALEAKPKAPAAKPASAPKVEALALSS